MYNEIFCYAAAEGIIQFSTDFLFFSEYDTVSILEKVIRFETRHNLFLVALIFINPLNRYIVLIFNNSNIHTAKI